MEKSTPPLGVAVIGAGYVAPYHLRALKSVPFVQIAAIADPDDTKAQTLARQFSIPIVAKAFDQLEQPIDVVHILTPPALHASLAIAAMRRNAHVFVEKPMAETVEDCDRMITASRETGRLLSVNHSYRFDPVILRAVDLVRQGAIGDVLSADLFRSSTYAPYPGGPLPPCYQRGSFPLQDLGVHALYLLETFLGDISSIEVRYRATGRRPILHFDEWRIHANCEKGFGQVYMSWNNSPIQNELVIHGSRGNLYVDCYTQLLSIRRALPAPMPITRMLGAGLSASSNLWHVPINTFRFLTGALKPNPGIGIHISRFYEAIRTQTAPPISPESARRIIQLLAEPSAQADAEKTRAFAIVPGPQKPRVLITGASGLLGGALLRRLQEAGEFVRILQRRPARAPREGVHIVAGDLGDPSVVDRAVEGVEVVYHVGAAMKGGQMEFECGTVWGTRNVVESCLRHGVKRLIYVSSLTILDHAGHNSATPVTESSPYEPAPEKRGHYTRTKLAAERIVHNAVREQGLRAVILRPGHVFGPGANFPPSGSLNLAGRWVVIGDGSRHVPFVYLDDVIDALLLAATHPDDKGPVFDIVDPDAHMTQREFVDFVCAHSLVAPKLVYIPQPVFMVLAVVVELLGYLLHRDVPLSRYRVRSLRPLWPCDVTAAQSRLLWAPRVGVFEGLRRTYDVRSSAKLAP